MEAKDICIVEIITKKLLIYHHQYLLSSTGRLKKSYLHFQNNDKEFGLYLFLEAAHFSVEQVSEDPD